MKILVVDDSKSIRNMVANVLADAGHTVAMACDGKEALEQAADVEFDVIIADINMPEMDGLQLVSHLRSREEYVEKPIIFLTTEGTDEYKAMGQLLGAAAWITKPFVPGLLLEAVSGVLKG